MISKRLKSIAFNTGYIEMVNGLYGLSGEAAKAARRAKLGIPEGTPAGKDYVNNVWLPAQKTANQMTTLTQPQTTPSGSGSSGALGFDLPNKIAGMPTWMMLAGAGIVVMFMFKGSSRHRK